jgi:predicted nucleic acid-binding protein
MAKSVGGDKKFTEADIFALERIFPSVDHLFKAHIASSIASDDALVVLDTNALLLPYSFKAGNLTALKEVYKKIAAQSRLFLPDRVAREFTRLRDYKLSEIIQALQDRKSQGQSAEMPPILDATASFPAVASSRDRLNDARKAYTSALDKLIDEIKGWRGDDPIVQIYSEVFGQESIVTLSFDEEAKSDYLADWEWRLQNKVPPGYKDQSKDDDGIGDYLIWRSLLKLGEKHQKNLAFVTGEQKADWFVRSGKSGVFPRPELLAEYRRASSGKTLRLLTLYQLLEEMDAPAAVVESVKEAEVIANTAISDASMFEIRSASRISLGFLGKRSFDYSTNDGMVDVAGKDTNFILKFSKATNESIHLYRDGNLARIGRIKAGKSGQRIRPESVETSSRVYTIQKGEYFLAQNTDGRLLAGKILNIADDTKGASHDEIVFLFSINSAGEDTVALV